jgi:hypothetical protein
LRGTAPRTALRPIRVANLNICQLRLANLERKNEIRLRANNEQRQRRHYCARCVGLDWRRILSTLRTITVHWTPPMSIRYPIFRATALSLSPPPKPNMTTSLAVLPVSLCSDQLTAACLTPRSRRLRRPARGAGCSAPRLCQ